MYNVLFSKEEFGVQAVTPQMKLTSRTKRIDKVSKDWVPSVAI